MTTLSELRRISLQQMREHRPHCWPVLRKPASTITSLARAESTRRIAFKKRHKPIQETHP